ncbi:MAG: hypothetical protein CMH67_03605 [Nisaea sp.]|jgi:hypothetical protein|nr:hypothetical protein [Nisaea sp.]OUX97598.1 MAG: hypothetical protein CBB86_03715 [Candidatus Endolissoclinum sp. TMED26]
MDILMVLGFQLVALLLGAMLFFSVVIAPLVFTGLDAETAGAFIRRLFPWYYLSIIVLAAPAAALLAPAAPYPGMIIAAVAAGAIIARQVLMPQLNRLRDLALGGDARSDQRFNQLHKLSVVINALQLLALIAVLVMQAMA